MFLPTCRQCLSEVLIGDGGGGDDDWENQWYNSLRPKRQSTLLRYSVHVKDRSTILSTKFITFTNVGNRDKPS